MTLNRSAGPERELELADSLAALRSRLAAAAEAAGRKLDEIQLLPITKFFPATDVAILSRLGCTAFGESRDQEAAAKVEEVARLLDGPQGPTPRPVAGTGTWSARFSATRPARWPAGRIPPTRSAAPGWWRRSTVRSPGHWARVAGESPLRVYVQISVDGDVSRGGVDVAEPGGRRRDLRAGRRRRLPGTGWPDGHPAAGLGAGSGVRAACRQNTIGCAGRIRPRWDCRRECRTTSKLRSNMVRRVCVSVPRYWVNDRYRHRQ